jgi:hypothetical protein
MDPSLTKKCVLTSIECGKSNFNRALTENCNFSDLNLNITKHCRSLKIEVPELSESELIQNRLQISVNPSSSICPKHRLDNGVFWRPSRQCMVPDILHCSKKSKIKVRQASESLAKAVTIHTGKHFPIGGTICNKCRKVIFQSSENASTATISQESDPDMNEEDNEYCLPPDDNKKENLENFNFAIKTIPNMESLSPIKYQVKKTLVETCDSTLYALKRKTKSAVTAFEQAYTEMLVPGRGSELRAIVLTEKEAGKAESTIISNLKRAVDCAPTRQMKAMLISTVCNEMSIQKLMTLFSCSRATVELAKQISNYVPDTVKTLVTPSPVTRKRLDMLKAEHFIDFLFSSGCLQDVAYGSTKITLSTGKEFVVPKLKRTNNKAHIIRMYENHATSQGLQPPSATTLLKILDHCKTSQRKSMQCVDTFVANGIDAFNHLSEIVKSVDLDSEARKKVKIF